MLRKAVPGRKGRIPVLRVRRGMALAPLTFVRDSIIFSGKDMNILICPLNWGLGHAARCVPVIRELRRQGHEIVIGASGRNREFLVRQFPDLECLEFPGISPRYPVTKRFAFYYLAHILSFLWHIFLEHRCLRALLSARRFGMVISDGRLGLFSRLCPSVLITHQLSIKCPRWEFAGICWGRWIERLLYPYFWPLFRCFDQIWVPDFVSPPDLSGELSHRKTYLRQVRFIGPLSRFRSDSRPEDPAIVVDRLVLLSGPEPQRTLFEWRLKSILEHLSGRNVMVIGKPEEEGPGGALNRLAEGGVGLFIFPHAEEAILRRLIRGADLIIARSGYTTIMELAGLRTRKILFVPTPGQTEQEYLARYLEEKGIAPWREQSELNGEDLRSADWTYRGFQDFPHPEDRDLRFSIAVG